MRRFFLILILGAMFILPSLAFAQGNPTISTMTVQFWPEYDQPSMLVITDFQVAKGSTFPFDMTFRIPADANLIAVASLVSDGSFLNAIFNGPEAQDEWQTFSITIDQDTVYRFEYYQPLVFNNTMRTFTYLWDGDYAADEFNLELLEPLSVTSLVTDPTYKSISQQNGSNIYLIDSTKLDSGEQYALSIQYDKSTDALVTEPQGVEPVAPLDENTPGRVSISNWMPYIIGGMGLLLIVGGAAYYMQADRSSSRKRRRRPSSHSESTEDKSDFYCQQCGTRARSGDKFCRVCGARLRQEE